jgi:pre-rRNA-processing protein IPI1
LEFVDLGMACTQEDARKISNWNTFKALNHLILTSLSEMGDGSLVLELIWNNLSNEIVSFHNCFSFIFFS